MRPQSAKAKGRRLQQEVRDAVLAAFPSLEPDDVRSTSMGASGADLLLSPAARKLFPFYVECKNQEALNIWAALAQAEAGSQRGTGAYELVVFKRNKSATYAALPFCKMLDMLKHIQELKTLVARLTVCDCGRSLSQGQCGVCDRG